MAEMAPMKQYQGRGGIFDDGEPVREAEDDERSDNPNPGELGKRYRREAVRLRTLVQKHVKPRVSRGGIY